MAILSVFCVVCSSVHIFNKRSLVQTGLMMMIDDEDNMVIQSKEQTLAE